MQSATGSPFYRVSVKALIFDGQRRLLVFQDKNGLYEMPGGGWEHGETLEECITRELHEEMRIVPATIGDIQFAYTGKSRKGFYRLNLVVLATLTHHNFHPSEDDLSAALFVTRAEFIELPFHSSGQTVVAYADQIWP